ncbi:MAG: helix-turn-helix transcriptional regulator [Acidimicrobiia bacterium]
MSDFGGLIREAREKAGLSSHRVAELVGRASGTVKAWERGRTVPNDPFVVSSLAAVLAIDEGSLFRAAGLDVPLRHEALTIEQELATIAPSKPQSQNRPPREEPRPLPPEVLSSRTADEQPVLTGPMPDENTRDVQPLDSDTSPSEAVTDFLEKSRDVIAGAAAPAVEMLKRAGRATRRPLATTASHGSGTGSYMEDPDERWSYRLRLLWTATGIGILGVLFLWAGSRALEAFGETWDALLAGL